MDEERSTFDRDSAANTGVLPPTAVLEAAGRGREHHGRGGFLAVIAAPIVEEIRRTLTGLVDKRKRSAAERLGSIAKGLHQVSEETGAQNRIVSRIADMAAGKVADLSETIQERPVEEIARSVGDYLRKRPVLVLGTGILAGFVVARLVRSGPAFRQSHSSGAESASEGTSVH